MSQMPQTPRNEAPEGSTFRGDDTPRPRSPVSTTNEPRASKAPADWDEQAEPNAYSDSWLPERPMRKPSAKATEAAGQQSPARPHSPHGVRWADVEDRSAKAPPEAASPTHSYGEPSTFDTMPGPSSVPYTPEPILSQEKPTQTDPAISKQHQSDLAMSKEDPYCPASYNAIPFAPYTRADSPRPTPLFSPLSDHHSDLDPASVFPSHYAHPDFQSVFANLTNVCLRTLTGRIKYKFPNTKISGLDNRLLISNLLITAYLHLWRYINTITQLNTRVSKKLWPYSNLPMRRTAINLIHILVSEWTRRYTKSLQTIIRMLLWYSSG